MTGRRATGAWSLACLSTLALAVLVGCSPEVGVHVRITMKPEQWHGARPFDHIMVTVNSGSYVGAACLFPRTATLDAAKAESTVSYACADQALDDIDSSLNATSWGLVEGDSRTVNFELPSAAVATVTASAGFGAATDAFVASGTITPAGDYPELALVLEQQKLPILAKDECQLNLTKVEQIFQCNPEQLRECLFPFDVGTPKHTDAVWLVKKAGCRVQHTSGPSDCKTPNFVAASGIFDMPPSMDGLPVLTAEASFRGRFARCRDGGDDRTDCTLTTQCKPPPTFLVSAVREPDVVMPPTKSPRPIHCLPPTAAPIHFKTDLSAASGVPSLAIIVQHPIVESEQEDACFFDLMDLQIEPLPQPR